MLKAVSAVALLVVVAALVALAALGSLFDTSPLVIALQLTAVAVAVWARRSFPRGAFRVVATPEGEALLRVGPYRLVRHPMYSAALLLIWSGVVGHASWWSGLIGVCVTCVVVARVVVEERLLRERFAEYGDYAHATKALVPFVV